ncbi:MULTISPECIES: 50S ribosomal protein L21 [unclassified Cocleimonas]|jgi:large subunit ribosomal protein L21|uniref:50S ribosomal protein L21 n=1 Tax=unclassified Cocleimonas TaxID=2639732 RepID=UPI003FA3C59D
MYAVIKTGGKQYRVEPGNVLKVESLDAEVGATVNFEEVLMIADGDDVTVGTPTIASAKVVAEVIAHGRAKKVEIVKFRRRKHHQKRTGHRQNFTQIQIQNINGKGAPAKKAKAATKDTDAETTEKPAKKAAAKPAAKKETAEKKPAAKKAAPKKSTAKDDLTKIEGVGPKAAEALVAAGLVTFADVAKAKVPAIQTILDEADGKFGAMKPDTWPKQAKLAADGKWDELKTLQDELDGGIEKK